MKKETLITIVAIIIIIACIIVGVVYVVKPNQQPTNTATPTTNNVSCLQLNFKCYKELTR